MSNTKRKAVYLFVLKHDNGSLLFGPTEQACFEAENPGVLYPVSRFKQLAPGIQRDTSLPLQEGGDHDNDSLEATSDTKIIEINYNDYSYFLLWLLEHGQLSYPSEILEDLFKTIATTTQEVREETMRTLLLRNIDSLQGKFRRKMFSSADELDASRIFYSFDMINAKKKDQGKDTKIIGPKNNKTETNEWMDRLRNCFFLHLRGGWFPQMNENIKGGLGKRCRKTLFRKCDMDDTLPFSNGIDENKVCITNFKDNWGQRRVYFDTSSPFTIIYAINRIYKNRPEMDSRKKKIGFEDMPIPYLLPSIPGLDLPSKNFIDNHYDSDYLSHDKRYQQLLTDLSEHKETAGRSMPSDTKVITLNEYFTFVKTLSLCFHMTAVPPDLFQYLYDNFIVPNKSYSAMEIVQYLSDHGWKMMSCNHADTPNKKKLNKILNLKGPQALTISRHVSTYVAWVHVHETVKQSKKYYQEDDDAKRIIPSKHHVSLLEKIEKMKGFPTFQYSDEFRRRIEEKCKTMLIEMDEFIAVGAKEPREKKKKKKDNPEKPKRRSTDEEKDEEDEERDSDAEFIDDSKQDDQDENDDYHSEEDLELTPRRYASETNQKKTPLDKNELKGLFRQAINEISKEGRGEQLQGRNPQSLPPLLPDVNVHDMVSLPRQNHSVQNQNQNMMNEMPQNWVRDLTQKQCDYLQGHDFSTQVTEEIISFAKHDFAPQLYTPKISALLRKGNLDELKTRLFISTVMERRLAEIRHLSSLLDLQGDLDTFSEAKTKDIEKDLQTFVELFESNFLQENEHLTMEEKLLLGRCYCAHWIFGRQLVRNKQYAFYLQLYESEKWIPVLFNSNIPVITNHPVVINGQSNELGKILDSKLMNKGNLVSSIPDISHYVGNEGDQRSSKRKQIKTMTLTNFLDGFFSQHGMESSIQLQCSYSDHRYPNDIHNHFYPCTFQSVDYEASCFSDLLYLAALHQLRRGFPIHDCQDGRKQMLRYFLERVCLLKQGMVDFIEKLMEFKQIHRGYMWLMIIFLKHNHFPGDGLHEKTFNDIWRQVTINKYLELLLEHNHKTATLQKGQGIHDGDCEYLWDTKADLERMLLHSMNPHGKRAEDKNTIFS